MGQHTSARLHLADKTTSQLLSSNAPEAGKIGDLETVADL
jgi:hypothetical protein